MGLAFLIVPVLAWALLGEPLTWQTLAGGARILAGVALASTGGKADMHRVAVTIPSYKVRAHVLDVIARIPPKVQRIYVVDDKCPQHSGELVEKQCRDPRVRVIFHEENQGVGGAVGSGYRAAIKKAWTSSSRSMAMGRWIRR